MRNAHRITPLRPASSRRPKHRVTFVMFAMVQFGIPQGVTAAPADSGGPLKVKSEFGTVVVTSAATPSWKVVIDAKRGGVITELRIPADGSNLVSNAGGRFEGLGNLIYVDRKDGGKENEYTAKGSFYHYGTTENLSVLEARTDRVIVEVTGRGGNQVTPKADVIRYRQRYTIFPERISVDGEVEWLFDSVVPGSHPELIQLNNLFEPGAVTGEMSVWDADTRPMLLLQTNSKGRNFPAGIDYPLTVEVPLRGGYAVQFRSRQLPEDFVQARFYWNEYQRQIDNKRGFAFKAWEGWPGNGNVRFPHDKPISYQYDLAIAGRATVTTELSPQESLQGFVALFNGRTLDGWRPASAGWAAENGRLVYNARQKAKGSADLPTLKLMSSGQYKDFILRFEFKLDRGANNGVAIRAPLEGDAAFVGIEVQVIDTEGWPGKLKPFQVHGSIYGVVPAKTGHLEPAGEWNQQEIFCQGRHVKVTLNGAVIVDANLDEVRPIDGKEHPGLARERGHIGFLGHTGRVEFRNIRLKELPAATAHGN